MLRAPLEWIFPSLVRKRQDPGMVGAASLPLALPPRPRGCSSAPLRVRETGGEARAPLSFKQRFSGGSENRIRGSG